MRLGLTVSYLASLEREAKNPTIDLLDRISETLAVHLSELFDRPPERTKTPKTVPKGLQPLRRKKRVLRGR